MTTTTNHEATELVTRAEALGTRFLEDTTAFTTAWEHPVETLTDAGLLEQASREFLHKYGVALDEIADVTGYADKADGKFHWDLGVKGTVDTNKKATIEVTATFHF